MKMSDKCRDVLRDGRMENEIFKIRRGVDRQLHTEVCDVLTRLGAVLFLYRHGSEFRFKVDAAPVIAAAIKEREDELNQIPYVITDAGETEAEEIPLIPEDLPSMSEPVITGDTALDEKSKDIEAQWTGQRPAELIVTGLINLHRIEVQDDFNPRLDFDDDRIEELAADIKLHGVLQAITVERIASSTKYKLVTGERRVRAAKLAGLSEIPAVVREGHSDLDLTLMALSENLHRVDLNPVELASTFDKLSRRYGMGQAAIAGLLPGKKDPSFVSNHIRLLKLPGEVLDLIKGGKIGYSHGMELVPIAHNPTICKAWAELISEGSLTVSGLRVAVRGVLDEEKAAAGQTAIDTSIDVKPAENMSAASGHRRLFRGETLQVLTKSTADESTTSWWTGTIIDITDTTISLKGLYGVYVEFDRLTGQQVAKRNGHYYHCIDLRELLGLSADIPTAPEASEFSAPDNVAEVEYEEEHSISNVEPADDVEPDAEDSEDDDSDPFVDTDDVEDVAEVTAAASAPAPTATADTVTAKPADAPAVTVPVSAIKPAPTPQAVAIPAGPASVSAMITQAQDDWIWDKRLTITSALDLLIVNYPYLLTDSAKGAADTTLALLNKDGQTNLLQVIEDGLFYRLDNDPATAGKKVKIGE